MLAFKIFFFFFFFFLIINRKVPVFKTKLALCQTQKNETQRSPRLICSEKSIVGEFLHTSAPWIEWVVKAIYNKRTGQASRAAFIKSVSVSWQKPVFGSVCVSSRVPRDLMNQLLLFQFVTCLSTVSACFYLNIHKYKSTHHLPFSIRLSSSLLPPEVACRLKAFPDRLNC